MSFLKLETKPPENQQLKMTNQLLFLRKLVDEMIEEDGADYFYIYDKNDNFPKPMDFKTVKRRLKNKYYNRGRQCIHDIHLIFSNFIKYYDESDYRMDKATDLQTIFYTKLEALPKPEEDIFHIKSSSKKLENLKSKFKSSSSTSKSESLTPKLENYTTIEKGSKYEPDRSKRKSANLSSREKSSKPSIPKLPTSSQFSTKFPEVQSTGSTSTHKKSISKPEGLKSPNKQDEILITYKKLKKLLATINPSNLNPKTQLKFFERKYKLLETIEDLKSHEKYGNKSTISDSINISKKIIKATTPDSTKKSEKLNFTPKNDDSKSTTSNSVKLSKEVIKTKAIVTDKSKLSISTPQGCENFKKGIKNLDSNISKPRNSTLTKCLTNDTNSNSIYSESRNQLTCLPCAIKFSISNIGDPLQTLQDEPKPSNSTQKNYEYFKNRMLARKSHLNNTITNKCYPKNSISTNKNYNYLCYNSDVMSKFEKSVGIYQLEKHTKHKNASEDWYNENWIETFDWDDLYVKCQSLPETSTPNQHSTSANQATKTRLQFEKSFSAGKQDSKGLKQDSTALKQDSMPLKQDLTLMKENSTLLKENSNSLKQDSAALKQSSKPLKQNSTPLKQKLSFPTQGFTTQKQDFTTLIPQDFKTLKHYCRL